MYQPFLDNLLQLAQPLTLLILTAGLLLGLFFGALPGLSATMAVAILLPITFSMEPDMGLAMLVATYIGGISGGLVAATLLRIPGTPSSIATTFDAYPLACKGEATKALATGMIASAVGGLISLAVLVAFAPMLSRFAIRFGAHEYAMLTLAALMLVIVLSQANLLKGLATAFLGLAVATVGFAPIGGTQRFTFGVVDLMGGIGIVPFMVGLFAVSQLIREATEKSVRVRQNFDIRGTGVRLSEFVANIGNMLRSSAIGIGIGVLPGIGGAASNLVAYGAARQASKNPEEFGKGAIAGVYASESANNASIGGALLPLITLGIPGDGVTAILIGGFTIHGLQPGPLLFQNAPDVVAMIYAAFLVATLLLLIVQLATIRIFPRVLLVPRHYLLPVLAMLMVVGTYAADNRLFDVWLMLGFGVLGYLLERYGFPLAPMVLGFVLGPIFETNLRRALMYSEGDLLPFVTRPISGVLLVIAVALLFYGASSLMRSRRAA
ncbi:tripartite tricarboxylate transporter permease [Chelativorans sp. SCAU2101]|uniref:Tripartite tricarboxylate transporter permease n=1 Tax=Chelativorans petroleitrophicus TaxID=2975484 RepID=A0A9X2X6W7_9HYPH|nr:tripartite tricarboxylate transporter permease [Chelativorans petroleitrophicus]MCT8990402.1 tripartite tricarboxylate transporter permease [Chelativorans petroleitrophicus]